MTRIYLTGAAVILLLILGIGYSVNYSAHKPAQNTNQDGVATPVAASETTLPTPTPPDNSASALDNANVQDNTIVPQQENERANIISSRTHKGRRYASRRNTRKAHEVANEKLVSYVSNDDAGSNAPAIEKASDYFGNTPQSPQRVTTVVRVRPANNDEFNDRGRRHGLLGGKVGFGPEIGFNQNGVTNTPGNIQTGSVNFGLRFNFRLGNDVAFQPGLLYINRGTKYIDNMDPNVNEKLTMHYLELPADLVFKFGNPDNTRFMVGAGPYVAYLLGAKDVFNTDNPGLTDIAGGQPVYSTSAIPQFDWGVDGFIGCTTPEGIYAKAGGQLGMQNIQQTTTAYGSTGSVRNYSIMVSVGYILGGVR